VGELLMLFNNLTQCLDDSWAGLAVSLGSGDFGVVEREE